MKEDRDSDDALLHRIREAGDKWWASKITEHITYSLVGIILLAVGAAIMKAIGL